MEKKNGSLTKGSGNLPCSSTLAIHKYFLLPQPQLPNPHWEILDSPSVVPSSHSSSQTQRLRLCRIIAWSVPKCRGAGKALLLLLPFPAVFVLPLTGQKLFHSLSVMMCLWFSNLSASESPGGLVKTESCPRPESLIPRAGNVHCWRIPR